MDVGAGSLSLKVLRRGAGDKKRAIQVDIDNCFPFVDAHVEEVSVTNDAGIIHDAIDPAESLQGGVDYPFRRFLVRNAFDAGYRRAPGRRDFICDQFGRRPIGSRLASQVIDYHFGSVCRKRQRKRAPDSGAGAGYDHDFALHHGTHEPFPII
jgi:hypothetical protein